MLLFYRRDIPNGAFVATAGVLNAYELQITNEMADFEISDDALYSCLAKDPTKLLSCMNLETTKVFWEFGSRA